MNRFLPLTEGRLHTLQCLSTFLMEEEKKELVFHCVAKLMTCAQTELSSTDGQYVFYLSPLHQNLRMSLCNNVCFQLRCINYDCTNFTRMKCLFILHISFRLFVIVVFCLTKEVQPTLPGPKLELKRQIKEEVRQYQNTFSNISLSDLDTFVNIKVFNYLGFTQHAYYFCCLLVVL